MKIFLSQTILNENSERPKDLVIETRRQSQVEYAVSSRLAHIFDRGNERVLITFSIERSHSSESDAENFSLTHSMAISSLSPCDIIFKTENEKLIRIPSATLSKIKIESDGIITTARYEFTAQEITI